MERRRFLEVLASACVAATANAALPVGMTAGNRYIDDDAVRKFKPAKLIGHFKEDKHRVYMFISFTCPFCAQTWREFAEWALGLPPPYRFVYVPVFSGGVQNTAGAAFYVVRELAPTRTPEFLREAFRLQGKPNVTGKDYIGILYKMGFSRTQISQTAKGEITRQRIARAMMLFNRYQVRSINRTPVFGVVGKYLTHTGFTSNGTYPEVTENLNWLLTDEIEKSS